MTKNLDIFQNNNHGKFGIAAADIDYSAIQQINVPKQVRDEIPTLNEHGFMKIELDEFAKEFIQLAKNSTRPLLELGTAYGYTAQKVLEAGAKLVANDLSNEHLSILLKNTKAEHLKNLTIKAGAFPSETDFPDNSFEAILSSRMMHFLMEDELQIGLNKIYNWLIPGGKFFFIVITPYHFTLRDTFLPTYNERRLANKPWPGIVHDNKSIAGELADDVPDSIQVFDIPQLEELLPKHGFKIEKIKLFDYQSNDSDGKGHVGFVAIKV